MSCTVIKTKNGYLIQPERLSNHICMYAEMVVVEGDDMAKLARAVRDFLNPKTK